MEGIKLVDFKTIGETLNSGPKPWDRTWYRNVQAEVLVPDEISLDYIESIAFISKASLEEGERIWGNGSHPPFKVDTDLFHEGFPYVKDALLTSQEVNKDNVGITKFISEYEFIVERDLSVTLLVNLKALPGLQASVLWTTSDGKVVCADNIEFEKEDDYWHWPSVEVAKLGVGNYFVEYCLGGVRWIRIPFKIRR